MPEVDGHNSPSGEPAPSGELQDAPTALGAVSLGVVAASFATVCRAAGLGVPLGAVVAFAATLGELAPFGLEAIYWGGRAVFVHRPEDVEAFNRAYATFFLDQPLTQAPFTTLSVSTSSEAEGGEEAPAGEGDAGDGPRYSKGEVLGDKDFGSLSSVELAETHRMMELLRMELARRSTRRFRPSRSGRRPDLRRSVRRSVRTEGTVVERHWLARRERPRRLVLLCDVSGSMDPYVREFIRFLHVAVAGRPAVEAFALGTRLTRLTRHLGSRDPEAALAEAARFVPDWSGGTRLGEGIREFNDRFGIRGLARSAIVVILSDGIERGEPELLGREVERLRRVAYRLIWVNPLKATPGYEPTARGMAAALPFLDEFVPGHSFYALVDLARLVSA